MGAETAAGRAIFISYRRADAEGEAGRLYDDLIRAFGDDSVFMDVAGIKPGADFRAVINDNVAGSGVLLAVIGPQWSSVTDATGARRLDDPNDFVRLEIGSALTRNIAIIPVLVHDAHMPRATVLPDDLKELSYRNSVELTHARWTSDVGLLINALKSYVDVRKGEQAQTIHATVPVQLPPPQAPLQRPLPRASKSPMMAGIAALVLLGLGGAIYLAVHRSSPQTGQSSDKNIPFETASAAPAPSTPAAAGPTANIPSVSTETGVATGAPSPALTASRKQSTPAVQPGQAAGKGDTSGKAAANTGTKLSAAEERGYEEADTDVLGTWQIAQSRGGTDFLERLQVTESGHGSLLIRAWGHCATGPCDWGTQPASYIQGVLITDTSFEPRTAPDEAVKKRTVGIELRTSRTGAEITIHNTLYKPNGGVFTNSFVESFTRVTAR